MCSCLVSGPLSLCAISGLGLSVHVNGALWSHSAFGSDPTPVDMWQHPGPHALLVALSACPAAAQYRTMPPPPFPLLPPPLPPPSPSPRPTSGWKPVSGGSGPCAIGPGRDLSGCDFANADMSNQDLTGATLLNAILDGANLRGTRLGQATLTGASMRGADLTNVNLGLALFDSVDARGARLDNVSLDQTVVLRDAERCRDVPSCAEDEVALALP